MKIKPVFVGIAVLGALLLFLSLSTIAKVFAANPRDLLRGVKTQPEAVQLLPKTSPAFISFLAKPEKLGLFTQLAAKPSDRGDVRHELANLKQQLRENWLLDYERDIQPWLDREITLAVTDVDLDHQAANGLQTGYLLAFVAKDVELAKTSIDAFWQELAVHGSDIGFEQYQGVSILSTSFAENQPAIAGTTLGKFVLFANDARVLHSAIDDLKSPSLALTSLENYRDRLAQISTGKFAVDYVNLAAIDENLPKASLLSSLSFDKVGIKAETLWNFESVDSVSNSLAPNPPSSQKSNSNQKSNITKAVPLGSSVIIGNNLSESLQNLKSILPPAWQTELAKTIAPIPFESNSFAWAQDDYAIAFLPKSSPKSVKNNSNQDWLLVAKIKDAKASAEAIAALDDLVRTNLTVGEVALKSQPATVWTKLSPNLSTNINTNSRNFNSDPNADISGAVVAAHIQTANYIYLSNSLDTLESAITLKENLANSKKFKKVTTKLSSDRQTYGYIDQNLDLTWLTTNLPSSINTILPEISNSSIPLILKHLDTIGFASNPSKGNIENSELFLFLK